MAWSLVDAPRLTDRTLVVTGANSGLGLITTCELARLGAHVVMGCRSPARAQEAMDRVRDAVPGARVSFERLDLADLASVRAFAEAVTTAHPTLHGLVNNAGIMAIPRRETTDGFEMQIGTNHLGHFALTAQLFPALEAGEGRIVHVTSMAHAMGRIRPDDPMGTQFYERWMQYGFSKLANLLFHYALARRLAVRNAPVISVAAHPGYADTNLQHVGPEMDGSSLSQAVMRLANAWVAQSAAAGAEPQLRAMVDPTVRNGDVFGPDGPFQVRGFATRVQPLAHALRPDDQAWLWDWSEQVTGVTFPLASAG